MDHPRAALNSDVFILWAKDAAKGLPGRNDNRMKADKSALSIISLKDGKRNMGIGTRTSQRHGAVTSGRRIG